MSVLINQGKNEIIETTKGTFSRRAIKTHFIQIGEDYIELLRKYAVPHYSSDAIVSISEKVISLCQNRIIRKEDMHITPLAKFLSHFASHSSAGIGVDSVWKMQFAIDHCGRMKIVFASVCAGMGKLLGKKGVFYDIAGLDVKGLDGFYDRSFPEYGEFGIMLPNNPDLVCDEIFSETGISAIIIDANDFEQVILGKSASVPYSDEELQEMIRDNPSGQSTQLTPFVLIKKI